MFPKFSKNLLNSFHVTLAGVFSINKDVIEVHNDKNIKFFYYDFFDLALEAGEGIKKTKMHKLVFEMAVLHLESCFSLVTFPNSHLIIYICQVQLSKILTST